MRTIKLTFLAFLFLFGTSYLHAQKIASDSEGESVFSNYSFDDYKIDISTDEPFSIGFSGSKFKNSFSKVKKDVSNKAKDYYFKYGLLNSGDQLDFSKLNNNKFGHSFKIGYQSIVTSLANINQTFLGRGGLGVSAFFNIDNFDYFNSATQVETTKQPVSYGVELNGMFIFKKTITSFEKITFISYFEAKYFVKTWNNNTLLNYQSDDNFILDNSDTIVVLEDFKGKYGVLDNDISRVRIAVSEPIFYRRVNLTPYIVTNITSNTKPLYLMGANFNFIQAEINRQELNFDSTFGIGIDYAYQDSVWSKPTVFLRGSINFGKYAKD